jgi:hypothetical protein
MGAKVEIFLEPHAKTEKIFEVILKITGHDFKKYYFDDDAPPNFEQKSSNKNSWYLKPIETSDNKIEMEEPSWFICEFKDIAKNRLNFSIHTDSDDGHIPLCKALYPQSTAMWCAIGKRLVDFFGGQVIYSDYRNVDDPSNCYLVKHGKFSKKKKSQDSDDRWHLYYNMLNEEPILTSKEIKDMQPFSSLFSEKDKILISHLEKYEEMKELEKELNEQPLQTKIKIIKV